MGRSRTDSPHLPMCICGLDEAGRGPFAGPLVAAAVIFPPGFTFNDVFPALKLRDSKTLSAHQRGNLIAYIYEYAEHVAAEIIPVEDINTLGLGWANRTVFERLIMAVEADRYIVDGNLKLQNLGRRRAKVRCVVRADQTEQAVSAASVVAKVVRDRLMDDLARRIPGVRLGSQQRLRHAGAHCCPARTWPVHPPPPPVREHGPGQVQRASAGL